MAAVNLKGKRALVTGASRGIGMAITEALTAEGIKTFITARDEKALASMTLRLQREGKDIGCYPADLADSAHLENMFNKAIGFLDGIDILVNNAGFGIKIPAVDLPLDSYDEMLAINLRAPFLLSKLAAPLMIAQKSGYIINIGSGASQTPIANYAAYCATKHGLLGFSESLALELREYNVKVSIILPGSTATYFGGGTPESKLSSKPGILIPEDVAESVLFLLRQRPQAWTSILNLRPLNLDKF
jgi:3-oxoacyl-[acyl-carrier protein] reductase